MLKKGYIYTKAQIKKAIIQSQNDCVELYEENGKQRYNFFVYLDSNDELFLKDIQQTEGFDPFNPRNVYKCNIYKIVIPNEVLKKAIERRENKRKERKERK